MADEIDIVDSNSVLDSNFYIDGNTHTITDYLDGVNEVLVNIHDTGDFEVGANTLRSMSNVGHAIGVSKAKLLHGMYELWSITGRDFDSFCQYVIDFGHLSSRVIISRYIGAWDAIIKAPIELSDLFLLHPMKNLNALGAALAQGYEPDHDTWEQLSDTHENNQFLKLIREDVKGAPPRKNSLTIYLEVNGDLIAWQDGKTKNIGYLDVGDVDAFDITAKGIERIVKGAGIIKR